MVTETRHYGAYPPDLALLQAAKSDLLGAIAVVGESSLAQQYLRRVQLIVGELLYRARDLNKLLEEEIVSGHRLIEQGRSIFRKYALADPNPSVSRDEIDSVASGDVRERHRLLLTELATLVRALWHCSDNVKDPRLQEDVTGLSAAVAHWESLLFIRPSSSQGAKESPTASLPSEITPSDAERCIRAGVAELIDLQVQSVTRLSGGMSRATWLIRRTATQARERDLVVRQQLRDGLIEGMGATVRQEFPLLKLLNTMSLPVPRVFALLKEAASFSSDIIVMERAAGSVAGSGAGESNIVTEHILRDLAVTLARLHSIDWRQHQAELQGSAAWNASLEYSEQAAIHDLLTKWRLYKDQHLEVASPALDAAFGWLIANIPAGTRIARILHGDLGFHNMLIEDGRLTALLDWETAHLGAPAKDVAHVKAVVQERMPWQAFLDWYVAAGGQPVDDSHIRYWEVFRAVTHVVVGHITCGSKFSNDPVGKATLTEYAFGYFPVFMSHLSQAIINAGQKAQ